MMDPLLAATLPGGWELIVILFIVLLLFGAKRLPDLAGSLGRSLRELRRSASAPDDREAPPAVGSAEDSVEGGDDGSAADR